MLSNAKQEVNQIDIEDFSLEGCVYTEGNEIDDNMLVNLDDLNDNSLSSESNTKLELPSDTETNLTMKKSKFKVCFHPAQGCKGAS